MEAEGRTAMVNVSKGMALTLTKIQMKIFTSIAAAAAVIGTSFITASPSFAGSRWIHVASSNDYNGYVSGIQRNGSIAAYQRQVVPKARGENSWTRTVQTNCKNWTLRAKYSDGWGEWDDILPGTNAATELAAVCR